jgi:hypothetical protein
LAWVGCVADTPELATWFGDDIAFRGDSRQIDLAGLPMLGVFAGKGASAAGTIVGIDASERGVRVYLDAGFDGRKELLLPPERVALDV